MGNFRGAARCCTRFFVCEASEIERDTERKRKMQAIGGRRVNFVRGGVVGSVRTSPNQGRVARGGRLSCNASLKDIRDRIGSVKNTQKITDAMKLVAAAKVRRAQDAVISGRPFAENLVKVLYGVNQCLQDEDVDSPLTSIRYVKSVLLVVITGDRGLCGGYNNYLIKKAVARISELTEIGVKCKILNVGGKGATYFKRRASMYELSNQF